MTIEQARKFLREISKALPENVALQRHLIPKWKAHKYRLALKIIRDEQRGASGSAGSPAPFSDKKNG